MKRNAEQILSEYLVISCQLGEKDAFDRLITLWYPKLMRYARYTLRDETRAQDAVQHSMEALCKSIKKLDDPQAFPKWIYRILHFKCADLISQHQKQRVVIDALTQENTVEDQPYNKIDETPPLDELDAALSALPAKLYKVVHLYYLEGFSVKEIAELINVREGTVKSRMYEARQMLKRHVEKNDDATN
uniref:RNA polymerase sigma factor n=1 Tax=Ningiella ruwaisensis TaxID=2364274 RepID=UPI0010A07272|nr:sigma-70 family RNA polymerase sigma factor [Ningiella ruwaisensis]